MSQLLALNLARLLSRRCCLIQITQNCSTSTSKSEEKKDTEEDTVPVVLVEEDIEDEEARQIRIARIRNKSRLLPAHRRMLMDEVPYPNGPESWIHNTVKYKRGIFGKYGLSSGIDPRICYPTATEKEDRDEYEKVAFPFSLKEMMKANEERKKAEKEAIYKREEEIAQKLKKLNTWINELNAKAAKKEAEARAAKERKERLIEEVRRHFGFTVDIRDDRFKEMLALKEKEDKKAQKEARKKQKEMKMMEKLLTKGKEAAAASTQAPSDISKDSKPN